jgi:lipopolysaccharide transport system ATP-binding protein
MAAAIAAEGLSKRYRIGELQSSYGTLRESLARAAKQIARGPHRHHHEEIWALRDVSFDVPEGQVLGVIGGNGAGKSTLLKVLTRITSPTSGRAEIRGRVGSLLEVGTGFHPELTGRENVFLNGSVLGMKRRDISRKLDEIVDFAGVSRHIDTPVKWYSSGMYVRLAFAVAAHLEPEILLVDEVLAVGDAEFQQRCLGRMEDFSGTGRTVVFVSHNMQTINQLCDRVIWLDEGRIAEVGEPSRVVTHYLQSTSYATGAYISWPDNEDAPGDDLARLLAVRAIDEEGNLAETVDVRDPIGIEMRYRILRPGPGVFTKIRVRDGRGDVAFNAMDKNTHANE